MIWANVVSWPWPWVWTPMPGEDLAGRVDPDLARIEHLEAEDVEVVRRPGPDDLGEAS